MGLSIGDLLAKLPQLDIGPFTASAKAGVGARIQHEGERPGSEPGTQQVIVGLKRLLPIHQGSYIGAIDDNHQLSVSLGDIQAEMFLGICPGLLPGHRCASPNVPIQP